MPAPNSIVRRVRASGVQAASMPDLLAIGFSRREDDVDGAEFASRRTLERFGSVRALASAAPSDLTAETGLEGFEVLRALVLMEIGRRSHLAGKGDVETIESVEDSFRLLGWLRDEKREHFVAILLDAKSNVLRTATIHIGTLTMSVVGPREVFREAIREGASSIIVGHNHPSGDPEPSPEDIAVTRELVQIGKMLDRLGARPRHHWRTAGGEPSPKGTCRITGKVLPTGCASERRECTKHGKALSRSAASWGNLPPARSAMCIGTSSKTRFASSKRRKTPRVRLARSCARFPS